MYTVAELLLFTECNGLVACMQLVNNPENLLHNHSDDHSSHDDDDHVDFLWFVYSVFIPHWNIMIKGLYDLHCLMCSLQYGRPWRP